MKKQVAILGLGRFGVSLANTLLTMGYDVLAMDVDEKRVQSIAPTITCSGSPGPSWAICRTFITG